MSKQIKKNQNKKIYVLVGAVILIIVILITILFVVKPSNKQNNNINNNEQISNENTKVENTQSVTKEIQPEKVHKVEEENVKSVEPDTINMKK